MRKQQAIWEKEHKKQSSLPSLASEEPSSGVISFINYLQELKITGNKNVIDIGCGKGRNAIYIAKQGYDVFAVDYVQKALDVAEKFAIRESVSSKIHFQRMEIDKKWLFENNFFDFAIDCFSSIDIETKKGRITYRDEMFRTMKPKGFALVTVVSNEDEWEAQLIKESPAKEKNSTLWPQNGKFQKDYDEKELREFYRKFETIKLQKTNKKALKLGKKYMATNFWLVLRKPE